MYVLVGASSNLPEPDRNHQRKPQDEALIGDLQTMAANLRATPEPPKGEGAGRDAGRKLPRRLGARGQHEGGGQRPAERASPLAPRAEQRAQGSD